jgi:hypothetical protein
MGVALVLCSTTKVKRNGEEVREGGPVRGFCHGSKERKGNRGERKEERENSHGPGKERERGERKERKERKREKILTLV